MSESEILEAMARALSTHEHGDDREWQIYLPAARAAYQAAVPGVLEWAAKEALNPCFIQARDTEWDSGFNDAKHVIAARIRALAAEIADGGEPRTVPIQRTTIDGSSL